MRLKSEPWHDATLRHAQPDDGGPGGAPAGDAPEAGSGSTVGATPEPAAGEKQVSTDRSSDTNSAGGQDGGESWIGSVPGDWREQIAGDDEGYLNALKRHTDLQSVLKSGWEAQQKIRKGEVSNGLPENATDEQIASWREANGVPKEAGAYEIKLEEGLVLGEADKKVLGPVQEVAHKHGISNEALSEMAGAMLHGRQGEVEAMQQQDGMDQTSATAALKENWGQDYTANLNLVQSFVSSLPESVRDAFASARLADGKALFNSPEVMDVLAKQMRQLNPAATIIPNSNNPVGDLKAKKAAYDKRMKEDMAGWRKDKDAQADYIKIVDALEQMRK